MRLVEIVLLLTLQCKFTIVSSGDGDEHIHFRIHVPEIIKHHIHTNTVFIHLYDPKKRVAPKKNGHVEHVEDWNVWSSYNDYDDHGDSHNNGNRLTVNAHSDQPSQNGYHHHEDHQGYVTPSDVLITSTGPPQKSIDTPYAFYYHRYPEPSVPHYDDYRPTNDHHYHHNNPQLPIKSVFNNGVTGYSYPPQYAVTEHIIEDIPDNSLENYKNVREEAHSKRLHAEIGHVYTNELNDFYNDKREDSHETMSMESKEAEESKNRDNYRYVGDEYLATRVMIR